MRYQFRRMPHILYVEKNPCSVKLQASDLSVFISVRRRTQIQQLG